MELSKEQVPNKLFMLLKKSSSSPNIFHKIYFSSPEHEVLMVRYYDWSMSVVRCASSFEHSATSTI